MNKKYLLLGLVFMVSMSISMIVVLADNPPSLTDFHQFYGTVQNAPNGATLNAGIGTRTFTTTIAADGKYGYSPTFKVFAPSGSILFSVVSNGLETTVGSAAYENRASTNLDFTFVTGSGAPVTSFVCTGTVPSNAALCSGDDQSLTANISRTLVATCGTNKCEYNCNSGYFLNNSICVQNSSASSTTSSTSSNDDHLSTAEQRARERGRFNRTIPDPCMQSWNCGLWSSCSSGTQTRSCVRIDQCDQLLAQRMATNITIIPKPEEFRSCQQTVTNTFVPITNNPPSSSICTTGTKRCFGNDLQRCSYDGSRWDVVQSCTNGCNPINLLCNVEAPAVKTTSSNWAYYISAIIILVVIIGLLLFSVFHKRKYGPVRAYIEEARIKGFSDAQLRSKLLGEGWDEKKVDKLLR